MKAEGGRRPSGSLCFGLVRLHDTVFDTELVDKVNWQAVDKPEHEAEAK